MSPQTGANHEDSDHGLEFEDRDGVRYVKCKIRERFVRANPEEIIRQVWVSRLLKEYGYPKDLIKVEYTVQIGGDDSKRADIVVLNDRKSGSDQPEYIIIETKRGNRKDGREQLKSYCNATGAPIGVWSNGEDDVFWNRTDPNYFTIIPDIPRYDQTLEDITNQPWYIKTLIEKEKERVSSNKALRDLIKELEDEVLANAGVDVFEEVFKLIFAKLFDELSSHQKRCPLRFRNQGSPDDISERIQSLFQDAMKKWPEVFPTEDELNLIPEHLQVCVGSLEEWKLFNSNLDVIDDAFEYLVSKTARSEKGQFFTPRWVIDMCVKMMNPKESERIIDTACGSSGFTAHSMFHVWNKIVEESGEDRSNLFTMDQKPPGCVEYVRKKVFAIDFDEKSVRVSRCLNLIAGDGAANVLHMNSLDYRNWSRDIKNPVWSDSYGEGWNRMWKLRRNKKQQDHCEFSFDIVMANPPFAGDIKQRNLLRLYDLACNSKTGKLKNATGRDWLFVERNLQMLKPGGRMAIVLPHGRFNNRSDQQLRDYIRMHCRILAVVGLHPNTFKPHTGTKTSVLFVQKWNDDPKAGQICKQVNDYKIFFAVQKVESVDNSGRKVYRKNSDGTAMRDSHGHLVVAHDLFNHEEMTKNGIAEAFIKFAKKEKFSFV